MNRRPTADNKSPRITQEYAEFLAKLDVLKNEQKQLIKEYREQLEQQKILRLKEEFNPKK